MIRFIMKNALKNPHLSSKEMAQEFSSVFSESISPSYLRKILVKRGIRSYKAIKKPYLTKRMVQKRKYFADSMIDKPDEFWKDVFFSDETYIEINFGSVINRVRRFSSSDPINQKFLKNTVKFPTKVMLWGCINYNGAGLLKICEGTMNSAKYKQVLESKLLPSIQKFSISNPIHLDDSAPCHRTNEIKAWHSQNGIQKIDWPGNSPDLNPIENLWSILKYKIKRRPINSKIKLIEEIKKIWDNEISQELCANLVMSMPKRLAEVKKCKGKITKY